jgi:RNA polymerase sigma-70 factor (sigma-E family)
LLANDEQEFGDYVAARSHRLCAFAYLICGDWHAPQDAVQTSLTKLYLAWSRVHADDGGVDLYVRRIIVRTLVDDWRRARTRREQSWAEVPDAGGSPDTGTLATDRLTVLAALAKVPPRQRAVLVLRYWEDQPVEAVARALGCSTGTVKSQAARGLQTLRELLGESITVDNGGSA